MFRPALLLRRAMIALECRAPAWIAGASPNAFEKHSKFRWFRTSHEAPGLGR